MSADKERVFIVGATGDIGRGVVRGLVKKGIHTTAFARNENKAKDLFKQEIDSGYLNVVIGNYDSIDVYTKEIEGHTRLFLLMHVDARKRTLMRDVKRTFARIAYEKGVRQIVDLSSFTVRRYGRQGIIGYVHTTAEEILWKLVEEKASTERSLVVLRPASFMSNHFIGDAFHVKRENKLVSTGAPSSPVTWIDTRDISDAAVTILSESIEKHDRCVYEMGGQTLTHEERAKIFSEVLGKSITYEQQSIEANYKTMIGFGLDHGFAYDLISIGADKSFDVETPQLSLLLDRPLYTLKDWLIENIKAFQ